MNKNILIGALAVVVVIGGAILFVNMNKLNNNPDVTPSSDVTSPDNSPSDSGQQAGAPLVTTDRTAVPSNSTVVVTGKVTPNGAQTSYWYEYGRTDALGTQTSHQAVGSGFVQINAPGYITGLNANTTYYFRLVAQNALGAVSGATYSFSTNNNPPPQGNAPTTRTDAATGILRTSANLNGHANPNNSQTSYWFEYGESSDLGRTTAFQSAGAGNASVGTSVSISDLKPLTKYYFRLDAQNQYGTVNSAILNFTTTGPAAPKAPEAITDPANNLGSTSVTMNGHVDPNGDETTYWFEYSKDSLLGSLIGSSSHTKVTGNGTVSMAVSDKASNLQRNTKYFYRIAATNSYGTVYGAIVNFQTKN